MYTNIYYIIIKNNSGNALYLNSTRSLLILIKDIFLEINVKNIFKYFLVQFVKYQTYKIKFTGKGYKIKKPTKKSFRFLFNKSHLCIIWWKNIHFKKYKKYKTYIRSINLLNNTISKILKIRMIDVFTKKGLRASRSIIYKKKGKK